MILTDERATNCVKAALLWMRSHNVKWLKTEEKIYSRKHDYAGTMDGLAYVDSCTDPACCSERYTHRLCLIDWKSSNQLKTEYCLQTAAYQQALQEEHNSTIESRWILRLGKSEEEAGKFEPWFLSNADFVTDLDAFLACLTLTRLVDSVEERMKYQKGTIRAVKKEQKETAKALAREQEKLQKALDKAEAKKKREEEKAKIKAEAKANREAMKAAKKAGKPVVLAPIPKEEICTSTLPSSEATELSVTRSVSIDQTDSLKSNVPVTKEIMPQIESITLTAATIYEEEVAEPTFTLPME